MHRATRWLVCVLVSLIGVLPALAALEDGLIIHFGFDEALGGVVEDLTGNGHDGTLVENADIVDETKVGQGALQITGGGDTMEVETFPALESYQDNTFLFWINFTAPASGGWDQIIAKPAPGSDRSPGLWVTPEGLSIHYRYNPGNVGPWGISPTGNQDGNFFEEGTWYHIAGVTTGGTLTAYVDGEEKAEVPVSDPFAQGAGSLYVGNSAAYAGPAAKFIVDDLAIYDRPLSQEEVVSVMNGDLNPVEANGKLSTCWGLLKGTVSPVE